MFLSFFTFLDDLNIVSGRLSVNYEPGTAEGEGLVGPRPHHFFAPLLPLFENQIL